MDTVTYRLVETAVPLRQPHDRQYEVQTAEGRVVGKFASVDEVFWGFALVGGDVETCGAYTVEEMFAFITTHTDIS